MIRFVLLLVILLAPTDVNAQQFYVSGAPQGTSVLVSFNCVEFPFNDMMKCATIGPNGPTGYPGVLDANGYPNNGTLTSALGANIELPFGYCNYHWVIDWSATTFGTNAVPAFKIQGPPGALARISVVSGSSFVSNINPPSTEMDVFGVSSGAGSYGLDGGSVEFTLNNCTTNPNNNSAPNLLVSFLANASDSGVTHIRLYRCLTTYPGYSAGSPCDAAKAAINSDTTFGGLTPDFVSGVSGVMHTQPKWLRFLGQVGDDSNLNNLTKAAYRALPSQLSYVSQRFVPSRWAGQMVYTAPSGGGGDKLAATTSDGSATLTDGLLVQGYTGTSTTTDAPCLALNGGVCEPIIAEGAGPASAFFTASISDGGGTCNSGSTYSGVAGTCMIVTTTPSTTLLIGSLIYAQGVLATIVSQPAGTPGAQGEYILSTSFNLASNANVSMAGITFALTANKNWTFTWDASLGAWETTANGLGDNVPIEIMAALCNTLNANMWYNIPPYLALADNSIQTIVNVALAQLNSQLSINLEFANEEWNSGFNTYNYANTFGAALMGLSLSFTNDEYYALRSSQYDSQAGAGSNPRVTATLAGPFYQNAGNGGTSGFTDRFLGRFLCWDTGPPQNCPQSNPAYQANIGVAYNQSPNRAADFARYISGAPYVQGGLFNYNLQATIYQRTIMQTATSNFSALATAADQWVSGDSTDAFAAITADLIGSSSQPLQAVHNIFTLNNPLFTNTAYTSNALSVATTGQFTGTTGGVSSTSITISNILVLGTTAAGRVYADPVNGSVLQGPGIPSGTILTGGPAGGGPGVYTMSNAVNVNETVQYSNSYLENWEQTAEALTTLTGHTVSFLPYEGAWQITGPSIADCNTFTAGPLSTSSTNPAPTGPKYYCGNTANPVGDTLVSGYKVGDILTFATDVGFSCTISSIAPDGTPLTCGSIIGGSCAGSSTNVLLAGGSGFNIAADLTCSGGAVTAVNLYSQVVVELIYAYMQSAAFQAVTTQLYNEQMAYPSTIGVAQSNYSGGIPFSAPWSLILGDLYGTKLQSWFSFQKINHGGFLLKRDLDPASNDNSPMWLNEAA